MTQKVHPYLFLLFLIFASPLTAQIDLIGARYDAQTGTNEAIRWEATSGLLSNVVPTSAPNVAVGRSVYNAPQGIYYFKSSAGLHEISFNPDTARVLNPQFQYHSAEVDMDLGKIYGLNSILTWDSSGTLIATRLDFVEFNIANGTENTLGTIPGISGFAADASAFNSNAGIYYFTALDSTFGICLYAIATTDSSFSYGRVPFPNTQALYNSLEYDNDHDKLYSLGSTLNSQGIPTNLQIFELEPTTAIATLEADFLNFDGFFLGSNTFDQASYVMTFRTIDSLGNFSFLGWDSFNDTLLALQIPPGYVYEIEADNEQYAFARYQRPKLPLQFGPNNEIHIYPNPTTGTLNVVFENVSAWQSIDIFDVQGRKLRHFEQLSNAQKTLDVSDLPTGQYFLRVQGNGKLETKHFQVLAN